MYCANLIRPPDVESCNSQACEVVWITGEWTEVRAASTEVVASAVCPPPPTTVWCRLLTVSRW